MPYVEWHSSIRHHWKTDHLMRLLGVKRYTALGIVGALSAWAIEFRPGGIVEPQLVPIAVDWDFSLNDGGPLVEALVASGWLDRLPDGKLKIHAWDDITKGYRKVLADVRRRQEGNGRATVALQSRGNSAATAGRGEERRGEEEESCPEVPYEPTPDTPPPPQGGRVERPAETADTTTLLVDLWNENRNPFHKIRVTPKRRQKVAARLREGFTPAQLGTAVKNLIASAFHNGDNDRGWRAPGPEWVLNSAERVEQFQTAQGRRVAGPSRPRVCGNCGGSGQIPGRSEVGADGRTVVLDTRPCPGCRNGNRT